MKTSEKEITPPSLWNLSISNKTKNVPVRILSGRFVRKLFEHLMAYNEFPEC